MPRVGRSVNPADAQRKLERKKELKRNRKQRTEVRESLLKALDPVDVIAQLRHIDEQIYEFDKQGKETLHAKRRKVMASYISIISFSRAQKDTARAKELQNILNSYENERRTMEERYNAVAFAREGDLNIPLPSGTAAPEDAMTPASMIPVAPPAPKIHPTMIKKPLERRLRHHPPGPPCLPPPEYDDYGEIPLDVLLSSRMKVSGSGLDVRDPMAMDDSLEPVEIPAEIMTGGMPSLGQLFPAVMAAPLHQQSLQRPKPPTAPMGAGPTAIISAPAQVALPTVDMPATEPIISAAPQMRDLWKETTRFVPTNIVRRPPKSTPARTRKVISYQAPADSFKPTASLLPAAPESKKPDITDAICDDFLASLQ